jgi:hypothetical protein
MAGAYIGTSGWNYRHWRGNFFPNDLPSKDWLRFYADRFDTVEINYTFYRLPSKESCKAWYQQTPENFRFAVKASRYITHIKRLRNARVVERFSGTGSDPQGETGANSPAVSIDVSSFRGESSANRRIPGLRRPRALTPSCFRISGSVLFRERDAVGTSPASRGTGDSSIGAISGT